MHIQLLFFFQAERAFSCTLLYLAFFLKYQRFFHSSSDRSTLTHFKPWPNILFYGLIIIYLNGNLLLINSPEKSEKGHVWGYCFLVSFSLLWAVVLLFLPLTVLNHFSIPSNPAPYHSLLTSYPPFSPKGLSSLMSRRDKKT